jgi:hypothetical protein
LLNTEAIRSPAFGNNGSQTGAIVEPITKVVILTESSIEKKLVRSLLADRNVVEVRHQALRIAYVDEDGQVRHHTVDIVATFRDGTKVGYVVKPEAAAVKHNARALVETLSRHVSRVEVSRLQLVTSRQLPEWGNRNARQLVNARRDRRTYVDDMMREIAPELTKPIRIGDLTARLGGGHVAFRPVLRAIHFGTLEFLGFGTIDENGKVRFSGQVMQDTDLSIVPPQPPGDEPPVILRRKKTPKPARRASYREQ